MFHPAEVNMPKLRSRFRKIPLKIYFHLYPKGWLIFAVSLGCASVICELLRHITTSDVHVPMIFVLAVLVVSLFTDGFFYGFLAAAVSVIGVNYAFTYPYLKLDFSVYGYPLTFLTMLAVGFAVSTLTSRLKLQEAVRMESEKEKMRANLLRAVSHDLRTPLTAISGSITTVLDNGSALPEEEQRELLSDAKRDADWLNRMVENLLSITRISGGEMCPIEKQDELLEEVLSEAILSFRKRHGNVAVSVSVPEDVLIVPMDAMLIEQVLQNLLDNAVIHGGASQISVRAESRAPFAEISVRDNGTGIDAKMLAHLFDGSLSLSASTGADAARSMGIGLSVCRTIIEAHRGTIRAGNPPDGGAEFVFTLPFEGNAYDDQG